MNPSRQFRSRQIEDAQYLAHAKRMGWAPSGYVSKAARAESAKPDYNSQAWKSTYEDEGTIGLIDRAQASRELRRTPYNPAKGLTTKYDPITGGPK